MYTKEESDIRARPWSVGSKLSKQGISRYRDGEMIQDPNSGY